jgi:hypothetical protein
VLRSIKELEFDRAMGKMSEKDFAEMSARLRAAPRPDAPVGRRHRLPGADRKGNRERMKGLARRRAEPMEGLA